MTMNNAYRLNSFHAGYRIVDTTNNEVVATVPSGDNAERIANVLLNALNDWASPEVMI